MIFKAITGSSGHAFGGKELYCTLWRRLLDAGLVALESISPGKDIYYGTLRCRTLPSKENYWVLLPAIQQFEDQATNRLQIAALHRGKMKTQTQHKRRMKTPGKMLSSPLCEHCM